VPKPRRHLEPSRSGPSWVLRAAVFLGVMGASAGTTFGVLSWVGPARAIPSPMPIGIVQALPVETAPVPMAPPAPRRVTVDSVAEGFKPDAASLRNLAVGWVDGAREIDEGAVLVVSGWAGDPELGLRVAFVGVGACGTIVATVPVEGERPDVRAKVHPNLDRSGWTARIFAGHLPSCEDRAIEAHAILPGGRVLAKLAVGPGALPPLSDVGAEADGPADLRRPGDLPGPELARARVARTHQPLRRCAGAECAEIARLPRGEHLVVVVDRRDGWALVSVPGTERAGWAPERDIERAPERLAQR
jgi:hypothetical protein